MAVVRGEKAGLWLWDIRVWEDVVRFVAVTEMGD